MLLIHAIILCLVTGGGVEPPPVYREGDYIKSAQKNRPVIPVILIAY